jgi:hypothetical protein
MSERERWVVYPLLFLALGAALRDKMIDRTTTKSIACQELLIVDEQPLGREPVLLARLGGVPRDNANDPYSGQFVLNGQIEVVDRDPMNQAAHRLITIGRAKFGPHGAIGGHVGVNGQVLVNGAINATFYAYQGKPIVPVIRGIFPGASLPAELLRAIPETLAPSQPASVPEQSPPANSPPVSPPSDSKNDAEQAPPPSPPAEQ